MNIKKLYKSVLVRGIISVPFFLAGLKVLSSFLVDSLQLGQNNESSIVSQPSSKFLAIFLFWIIPHMYIGVGILQNKSRAWLIGSAYCLITIPIFLSLFTRGGVDVNTLALIVVVYILNVVTTSVGYLKSKSSHEES